MKQITNKTILKQGNKTFQVVESDGVIYWRDELLNFVAQSQPKLEGIPVISLDSYVEKLAYKYYNSNEHYKVADSFHYINGYKANPNSSTQKDIKKAIELARIEIRNGINSYELTNEQILQKINEISIIEIDEQFNIISYE